MWFLSWICTSSPQSRPLHLECFSSNILLNSFVNIPVGSLECCLYPCWPWHRMSKPLENTTRHWLLIIHVFLAKTASVYPVKTSFSSLKCSTDSETCYKRHNRQVAMNQSSLNGVSSVVPVLTTFPSSNGNFTDLQSLNPNFPDVELLGNRNRSFIHVSLFLQTNKIAHFFQVLHLPACSSVLQFLSDLSQW